MKEFTVGSLFAGVGGICLGFKNSSIENACYKLSWANEIDDYACRTYKKNFSHTLLEGDINLVLHPENIEEVEKQKFYDTLHEKILENPIDILNGGFPCQAFSIAGQRKGFDDERGNLFLNIIDLINQLNEKFNKKPRVLFLENVKNLKSHDNGNTYKVIKQKLEDCGYKIFEHILNTMDYSDLPQNRERIYIIGFLYEEDSKNFNLFEESVLCKFKKNHSKLDRENEIKKIIDYVSTSQTQGFSKYYYTKEKYPNYFNPNGIDMNKEITEMYQFYQCRRGMYIRKNKSDVCPTLTANMGTGGHNVPLVKVNDGIRKLTPKEVFKLQGFPIGNGYELPIDMSESHLYKQAGNAVSVDIIKILATEILKIIEKTDK